MSIEDTKLKIPGIKIPTGMLLDMSLFGVGIRVPPIDIVLVPDLYIDLTPIWNVIMAILDKMADEYYERKKRK